MSYPTSTSGKPATYFELSRTLTYSALAVLPLLVLYEAGIWWVNAGSTMGVRNAADAMLKEPFLMFGPWGRHILVGVLLIGALMIYELETKRKRIRIVRSFFLFMAVESMLYALFFGKVVTFLLRALLGNFSLGTGMSGMDIPQRIVLSLGAGLYEELVFRVLLVSAIFLLLQRAIRAPRGLAYAVSALLGALIFSGYHYLGPFGDPFQIQSFLYRFVAGLVLNVIFLARGFGIAAYTHALYDVLVTVLFPLA